MSKKWFTKDLEKLAGLICEARNIMEEMTETQQEKVDNYPENLQSTTNFENSEERLSYFENILQSLEEIESNIEEVQAI
jgi:hypothetical protein